MATDTEVPAVPCHATIPEVYAAMTQAYASEAGVSQSPEDARRSVVLLMSQWSFETGAGGSCMNWNLAGIKHVPGDGHAWARYETHEVVDGKDVIGVKEFRAYESLAEGALDYVRVLHGQRNFAQAWDALLTGSPAAFVHACKLGGYFTGDEVAYTKGVASIFGHYLQVLPPAPPPTLPDPVTDELVSEIETGKLEGDGSAT